MKSLKLQWMRSTIFKKSNKNFNNKCFRRCPKAFHNNYNCINHIGTLHSQYPFGDTLGKKPVSYRNQPTSLQCKSTDWFLYDARPHQSCLQTDLSERVLKILSFLVCLD